MPDGSTTAFLVARLSEYAGQDIEPQDILGADSRYVQPRKMLFLGRGYDGEAMLQPCDEYLSAHLALTENKAVRFFVRRVAPNRKAPRRPKPARPPRLTSTPSELSRGPRPKSSSPAPPAPLPPPVLPVTCWACCLAPSFSLLGALATCCCISPRTILLRLRVKIGTASCCGGCCCCWPSPGLEVANAWVRSYLIGQAYAMLYEPDTNTENDARKDAERLFRGYWVLAPAGAPPKKVGPQPHPSASIDF